MATYMRLLVTNAAGRLKPNLLSTSLAPCVNKTVPQRCMNRLNSSCHQQMNKSTATCLVNGINSSHQTSDNISSICQKFSGLGLGGPLVQARSFSALALHRHSDVTCSQTSSTRTTAAPSSILTQQPHRTVIRYSYGKGKKKTVKPVIDRFLRLENGLWVRTQAGRAKKLWKKKPRRRYRIKQHVFCNKQQSKMLDRMVCGYWRKRRYFVDDPYEKYQERNFDGYKEWQGEKPFVRDPLFHENTYEKNTDAYRKWFGMKPYSKDYKNLKKH